MRHGSNYTATDTSERRRQKRAQTKLNVRFLLENGSEHSGTVSNISVGGMAIACDLRPPPASRIIAYVQELGRLEGIVSRTERNGFAVLLTLSALRRDKLEERLGASGKRGPEARKYHRESTSSVTRVQRADGREIPCRVIDLSLGGVSIAANEWPPLGEQIMVGKMRGRVVRHHETGFAIEFQEMPPSRGSLAEQLVTAA